MWQPSKRYLCGLAALVATVLGLAAPVQAGDRALADIIGFSADGRYFAFEEFGVQDGSGFAYSSIYMIDLAEDRWVIGTPIRAQAEDESTSLIETRRLVQAQALSRLDDLKIHVPAETLALIGAGTLGTDGLTLKFGFPGIGNLDAPIGEYEVALSTFDADSAAPCNDWFGENPLGFAISLTQDGVKDEIYRDDTLPRSRGCPVAYKISGVYAPSHSHDLDRAVALISVYSRGFEGPDRRVMAVPLGLDQSQ
jgi:predicted secreted protein